MYNFLKMKKNIIIKYLFFTFYSLLFLSFYAIEPIRRIIFKDQSQTLMINKLFLLVVFVLLILLFIYFIFLKYVKYINFKQLFIFSLFINLALLFVYPITSNDLFSYIYQARIWTVFNESPYLISYLNFSSDIFYNLLENKWSGHSSPYGPIFLIINIIISYLSFENIWLNLYLLKAFFIGINLLNGFLVYKLTNSKLAFYLYAFNPLILFEITINGHNDALFIFFILFSILLAKRKKILYLILSFVFLAFSILTKYISLIFLPAFLFIFFKKIRSFKKSLLFIFLFVLIFLIFSYIFYYPFLENLSDVFVLIYNQFNQYSLSSSFFVKLIFLFLFFFNIENLSLSLLLSRGLFLIFYALILTILFEKKLVKDFSQDLIFYFSIINLFFVLMFFSWFLPWYLLSIICLFSLFYSLNKKREFISLLIIFSLSFYGILQYLILR